jgi:hypothetical protein
VPAQVLSFQTAMIRHIAQNSLKGADSQRPMVGNRHVMFAPDLGVESDMETRLPTG